MSEQAKQQLSDQLSAHNHHHINYVGGYCPVQGWGYINDGRPWFFHARHNVWRLRIGELGDPVNYVQWRTDGAVIAQAEYERAGWMDHDIARDIIRRELARFAEREGTE